MRIETTQDRAVINHEELLELVKDHIEKKSGRQVDGKPHISHTTMAMSTEFGASARLLPDNRPTVKP